MSAEVIPPLSSPARETITVAPALPHTPVAGPSSSPRSPLTRTLGGRPAEGGEPISPRTSARLRGKSSRTNVLGEQHAPDTVMQEGPQYLQPSEFSPLNNNTFSNRPPPVVNGTQWLSPEDDKMATRGIPIFRPTYEEFQDFEGYVTKTVPWGQYSGIVKIIPPDTWTQSLPPIPSRTLSDVRIKSPIQQNMLGQAGLFRQTNVEKNKNRPFTIKQWFEKATDKRFAGPGPKDVDLTLDRDSSAAKAARRELEAEKKRKREQMRQKRVQAAERKAERMRKGESEKEDQEDHKEETITADDVDFTVDVNMAESEAIGEPVPPLDPSTHQSPQSSPDPLARTPESNPDPVDKWYEQFDPSKAWLPKNTAAEDYTSEACVQMERKFWKTMGLGEPSWYGADLQGTLFPDPETPWNVARLPNLLNRLGRDLPGVNRPYLYFGMWRAAFAWHVEDMDLFSINYIHFGAPKFWYAIPQGQAEHFERTITSYFPQEAKECDQFLRHKSYIMSPTRLAKDGINVNMLIHNQGEFVITYPRGYHAGFNLGFNCAESVNFALDSWLELGRRAKVCQCVSHSVRIDVDELIGKHEELAAQQEKVLTEQELLEAIEAERSGKPRKRMSVTTNGDRPRKRPRVNPAIAGEEDIEKPNMPVNGLERKKKVFPLEEGIRPATIIKKPNCHPCILCPHPSNEGLLPVYERQDSVKSMCKAEDGIPRAHELCVNSIPEVWIGEEIVNELKQLVVLGVNGIEKSRWNLKCQSCKDKKTAMTGAKIQCVNGKCPRAFHVRCARDDEDVVYRVWEVDEWKPLPIPSDASVDVQHEFEKVKTLKTEVLCPNHNPDIKEAKKAKQAKELKQRVLAILPGQTVKIKTTRGSFVVKMVRILEENQKAEVEHENGSSSFVKWSEFDFRPGPAQLLENEYARVHTHTRRINSDNVVPVRSSAATQQSQRPSTSNSGPSQTPVSRQSLPSSSVQRRVHPHPPVPSHGDHRQIHPMQQHHRYHPANQYAHPSHSPYHSSPPQLLSSQPLPMHHQDPRQIPSRVVVCDSNYSHQVHQPQSYYYGNGPYGTHQPAPMYHPPPDAYYQPPSLPPQSSMTYNYADHPRSLPPPHLPRPAYSANQAWSNGHSYQVANGPLTSQPRHYSTHGPPAQDGVHRSYHPTSSVTSGTRVTNGNSRVAQPAAKVISRPTSNANGVGKIDLGLQRMTSLMRYSAPLRTPAIHLAGTNGKGSVSAILESCFRAAGLKVARYNSPHLLEPRDAIALDGVPPDPSDYARAMRKVQQLSTDFSLGATTFEVATATAYDLITAYHPDVMIIECGMGGEGDATNVIPPNLVLATGLTAVGLDHTAFLGDTIEAITKVKAGIAVKDGIMCLAPQVFSQVTPVAQSVARKRGSRLSICDRVEELSAGKQKLDVRNFVEPPSTLIRSQTSDGVIESRLGLPGKHQLDNVALAIGLLTSIRTDERAFTIQPKLSALSNAVISRGISEARWPGRCSWLKYPTIKGTIPVLVDGAHNADSAKTLRAYIDSLNIVPKRPITWVIALSDSKGKTPESVLGPLLRKGDRVYATQFGDVEDMPWVKPVDPETIRDITSGLTGGEVHIREDISRVMSEMRGDEGLVVVAGSLYLVAEFYKLVGAAGA